MYETGVVTVPAIELRYFLCHNSSDRIFGPFISKKSRKSSILSSSGRVELAIIVVAAMYDHMMDLAPALNNP